MPDTLRVAPRRDGRVPAVNNDRVTAAPAISKSQIHSLTRPNMVSVGTIVWLSSELMFFAALFAMYFSIRAADYSLWKEHTPLLDLAYATPFTVILVLSSVTCQLAWVSSRARFAGAPTAIFGTSRP